MIRQRLNLIYVMAFVWVSMIFGLFVISMYIVPLELPGINSITTGVLKVILSLLLSILWLWMWRRMVVMVFWQAVKEQQSYMRERPNKEM